MPEEFFDRIPQGPVRPSREYLQRMQEATERNSRVTPPASVGAGGTDAAGDWTDFRPEQFIKAVIVKVPVGSYTGYSFRTRLPNAGGTWQIPAVVFYGDNGAQDGGGIDVTHASIDGAVATLTTDGPHGMRVGETVTVSGVGPPYDGEWLVKGVPSETTFTFDIAGSDDDQDVDGSVAFGGRPRFQPAFPLNPGTSFAVGDIVLMIRGYRWQGSTAAADIPADAPLSSIPSIMPGREFLILGGGANSSCPPQDCPPGATVEYACVLPIDGTVCNADNTATNKHVDVSIEPDGRFKLCRSETIVPLPPCPQGQPGGPITIAYAADLGSVSNSDPGAGKFRLNNATQSSATAIRASVTDAAGNGWAGDLDAFDDSSNPGTKGHIRLAKADDSSKYLRFNVSAVDSSVGYRNITVANVGGSSSNPFTDGDSVLLTFERVGDAGAAATVTVGTTTTGAAGSSASVTNSGSSSAAVFNFTIPRGDTGVVTATAPITYNSGTQTVGITLDTDGTLSANSDAKVASQKAVKTYVDAIVAANDAMVFKGVIDCSANPNYPAADRGWTYRVSVAGKIGGASGINVEAGDLLICLDDGTAAGNQATVGSHWTIAQTNLDGAVIGPASATDGDFVLFDGTSGKLIKDGFATAPVNRGGTGQTSYTDGQLLIGNSAGNTLAKASLTAPAAGFTITGGAGSITFALANDLAALEALSGTNTIYYRSGADAWSAVTIGSNLTFSGGTLAASAGTTYSGDEAGIHLSGTTFSLLAIPSGTPALGSVLVTNIAAPSTPASGKTSVWVDSTDKRLHDKNDAGVIGTTVVASAAGSHQFASAVSAAGVFTWTQPAFTDVSGSVAASQMPALTGDVTTSAGAVATTIAAHAVTNGKFRQSAANTLVGNPTGSTADVADVTVGAAFTFVSGELRTVAFTGDVTTGANSVATTIANDAVTFAKMQNVATDSLVGRDTAGTGDPENILLNATLEMDGSGNLRRAALTGDVTAPAGSNSTTIANDAVTYAKMQNVSATSRVLGRKSSGAGDTEELTATEVINFFGTPAQGDILYYDGSAWVFLAPGTAGDVLKSGGTGANPSWVTPVSKTFIVSIDGITITGCSASVDTTTDTVKVLP